MVELKYCKENVNLILSINKQLLIKTLLIKGLFTRKLSRPTHQSQIFRYISFVVHLGLRLRSYSTKVFDKH